jgi:hypothetical protein
MVAFDPVTNEWRPSSGAFKPDEDGVSVYRRSLLEEAGLSGRDVQIKPENLVAGVVVGDVRSLALGVVNDPWPPDVPEPDHPRNGAHSLVTGLGSLGKGERIRRQREIVKLPSIRFIIGP